MSEHTKTYRGYTLDQRAQGWDIRTLYKDEVIDTAITLALAHEMIDAWLDAK